MDIAAVVLERTRVGYTPLLIGNFPRDRIGAIAGQLNERSSVSPAVLGHRQIQVQHIFNRDGLYI